MAFGLDTEVPNTRVILRQPDVIVNRSLIPIQPVAEFALSASYAQSASYVFGSIESASYSLYAVTASYVSGAASNWDTLTNKPAGLISSSTQIINYNIFATTGSNQFKDNQFITGSIFFEHGGTIIPNDAGQSGSVDIKAGSPSGWAELQSYDANQYVWVDDNGAYIATNWNSGSYSWIFDRSGSLTADGPINAPEFTGSLFGTSSWAQYSLTASYVQGDAGITDWSEIVNKPQNIISSSVQIINYNIFATTGSNTFTGNQTFVGSIFITGAGDTVFSSSRPFKVHEDIQAIGNGTIHLMVDEFEPHIEIYDKLENNYDQVAELFIFHLDFYNTSSGYFGIALDGIRAGYSGWDGPIIGGDNGIGGYPAFIGFQDATNYTDGRVTILTPLSASAGITGSLFGTSSWAQNTNLLNGLNSTAFATTGSNTFTATQTIAGNLFLSSSFPLVYNNNSANNMLFGFFDGSSIYGAYYQIFGNTYSNILQRGGAEFVYDTRNNSDANFHIASFNGMTWIEKFKVDDIGAHVTGSLNVTQGITGSLFGTASYALQAQQAVSASWAPPATVVWDEIVNIPTNIISSSNQIKSLLPDGTVSSSAQYPGWVTASNQVDITATTNYTTFSSSIATKDNSQDLIINALTNATGSYATTGSNIFTDNQIVSGTITFEGGAQVLPNLDGYIGSIDLKAGDAPGAWAELNWNNSNYIWVNQDAAYIGTNSEAISKLWTFDRDGNLTVEGNIFGAQNIITTGSNTFVGTQNISNTTNSTNYTDGALVVAGGVGIGKDVNISGSLTVIGLLTAISMSTQYVTSSQYVVGTSRIILNDDDLVRFAGISVIDSGSTYGTGSLLWDSFNNRWIYQADDQAYNSGILIAGPKNYGNLGDEVGLVAGRIPVATGDDHIDTNSASSSIYIDFADRKTYIEAGLYVTGSITASNSISGTLIGTSSWANNSLLSFRSAIISTGSAPSNPIDNELWYDNDTGKTYIYYVSASVKQWVLQSDPTYDPGPILPDLQDVTDLGATTTNVIQITNTTQSTSKTSGALIVSGGLGVGGNVYSEKIITNEISGSIVSASVYIGQKSSLIYVIDGGGSTLQTGVKGDLYIPFDCKVTEWILLSDQAGSIVIDVWSDTYGNYPPTNLDSIAGTDLPTLSGVNKNKSTALTGWNPNISAGNTLRFNINSVSSVTRITLTLNVTKT